MRMPRSTMLVAVAVAFLVLASILLVKRSDTKPVVPHVSQGMCNDVAEFMCEYYKWPERTQYADPSVGFFQHLNSKGQYATKEPPPEKYSSRDDIAFHLLLPAHFASDRPELIAYAVLAHVDKSEQTCCAFFLRNEAIVTIMLEIRVLNRILGIRSDAVIEPDFYVWSGLLDYELDSYRGEKHGKES